MCYWVSQSTVISMKRYLYPIQRDDIATSHKLWKPTEKWRSLRALEIGENQRKR